jgi:hypothetical protein
VTRLKLSDITDEKPVRLTIEIPARLHRELLAYAVILNNGEAKDAPAAERLIPPMLERFIATDRGFSRLRKSAPSRERQG